MRRALLSELPALSHVFGLKPWEIPRLTIAERGEYLRYLRDLRAAASE